VLFVRPGRTFVAAVTVIIAILFVDDLYSLPYPVTTMGLVPISIPRDAVTPSVHAQHLKRELQPLRQRALAIGGTHRDAVVPAAFARLWNIPIAGGYGPMLLDRYSELAAMGTNGSVRPGVVGPGDLALDLLAVRYILVQQDDLAAPPTIERGGITWNAAEMGLPIGRPDCGHDYARSTWIPLPSDIPVTAIALVTHLRCSEDVPQGADVMRVRVVDSNGVAQEAAARRRRHSGDGLDGALRASCTSRAPATQSEDPPPRRPEGRTQRLLLTRASSSMRPE
jgi:hypothetical protein